MKKKIIDIFQQYNIRGIALNSNSVKPDDAFFAIKGENSDGNNYIKQALEKGAKAVFTDDKSQLDKHIGENIILVEDARLAVAVGAGIIYPKLPDKLIAVTGTNGKSSVVSYCFQILKYLDISAASLGTIGIETTDNIADKMPAREQSELTMADPVTFRKNLHELAEAGAQVVAFEASSHGLDQKRMGDIQVDAAGFTSFSQDHLDYHKTMVEYLAAKLQLFEHNVRKEGVAVLPSSIAEKGVILDHINKCELPVRIIDSADIEVESVSLGLMGREFDIKRYGKEYRFKTEIIASFQSDNLLMAAELVSIVTNVYYSKIIDSLSRVKAVKGRLERVTDLQDKYQIFVDYAHTPDSLDKSLQELRKHIKGSGKLYVIFGCGGDRDNSKRLLMGWVAAQQADYIVITDDNPRTESPDNIRTQIIAGIEGGNKNSRGYHLKGYTEIGDRKKAIESTIDLLKKDDILLIAGKGHEDYQIIGTTKHHFSDALIVQEYLRINEAK